MPVDQQGGQDVTVPPDDQRAVRGRDDATAVGVGQQDAVPHRHQPRRARGVLTGQRRAGHVEQHLAVRPLQPLEPPGHGLQGIPGHRPGEQGELRQVGRRGRAEPLQVAPGQPLDAGVPVVRHLVRERGGKVGRPVAERPRPAGHGVHHRRERPQRPPRPRLVRSEPCAQQRLALRVGAPFRRVLQQVRDQGVGGGGGQPGFGIALVV